MQEALDMAGITLNKNTIPNDPCTPFNPSGIRLGTPIMTQRGMKEVEMQQVADLMNRVSEIIKDFVYLEDKDARAEQLQEFRKFILSHEELKNIREEVKTLCKKFPIYS
jgi:glycine hydroxymethyltransferase